MKKFKVVVIATSIFANFLLPSFAELTEKDLLKLEQLVRGIVKEEIAQSEKRTREYVDLRHDALDQKMTVQFQGIQKQFDAVQNQFEAQNQKFNLIIAVMVGIFTLLAAIIGLLLRSKEGKEEVEELRQQAEADRKIIGELQQQIKENRKIVQQLQQQMGATS